MALRPHRTFRSAAFPSSHQEGRAPVPGRGFRRRGRCRCSCGGSCKTRSTQNHGWFRECLIPSYSSCSNGRAGRASWRTVTVHNPQPPPLSNRPVAHIAKYRVPMGYIAKSNPMFSIEYRVLKVQTLSHTYVPSPYWTATYVLPTECFVVVSLRLQAMQGPPAIMDTLEAELL